MAVYNLSNEPKKVKREPKDKNRTIGIVLMTISTVAFFVLLTNFIPFLKSFLLGVFGLFSYPLFITMFVVALALINNKKYIMTTKYIVYLSCAIVALLCLLHLLFISTEGTFFEYLGRCYTKKLTIGGIICGLITSPIVFILNKVGAYIIFSVTLIVFGALLADYIFYLNKSQVLKQPIKFSSNNNLKKIEENELKVETKKEEKENVNIVLDAKLKNEPIDDTAKRKLGLIKSSEGEEQEEVKETKYPSLDDKKSIKEFLLSPRDSIDMSRFSEKQKPEFNSSMQNTIEELKNSNQMPNKIVHDFSVSNFDTEEVREEKPYFAPIVENIEQEEKTENTETDFAENVLASLRASKELETKKEEKKQETLNTFVKPKQEQQKIEENEIIKPKKQLKYTKPSIELLTTKSMDLSNLNDDVITKRDQLENTLETFGIPAKVNNFVVGPAVTRYEIEMPAGISVKKVISYQDDIALNLAAEGNIRIEAPIPGKSAVGIEVPNKEIATVGLKDMIASPEFQNCKNPLTFVLGKDLAGTVKLCNLAKMPHLLVAGSTGSGKSVCLNAVILSLIYKTSPDDVRLILIDPKQVEFSIYNGLPHLLIPNVVTDSEKALNALTWAVNEMERRYTLFMNSRTKEISEYNSCSDVLEGRTEKLPYIVIIVDEVADLLMTAKKDVEEKIARLAQKARAAGIHLILATQRPSVDVITGTMKNNFPSRITFKLMSFNDSRTILDQGGAEKLLGRGDMLYKPSDASEPKRIQGCFVTSSEIASIVDYVKEKNSEYDFDDNVLTQITNPVSKDALSSVNGDITGDTGFDPLMPQALKCVIENNQASISMLQRKLVIGYPRAARIIDQMQEKNFISAQDGSKPRSVLITMEQYNELFGEE